MDLREYEQIKFRLAELIRASGALNSRLPQPVQDQVRELFGRLAEDRFNLVVVGRFSRGKTSLMNAVLGTDRLPTGIRPLTSVITTLTYGSKERAVIHFAGLSLPQEVSLAELPQFITEQGNSANHRRVSVAQVQLPVELLRRGFYFIDTPGLGSPNIENTRTTERFLPEADAFVLVTSYEGPLSDEEVRFLRSASAAGQPVFIVVNKQDMATAVEREEAQSYLREQLRGLLDGQGLGIFSLSARDGLAAKQTGDARLFEASGVAAFEAELVRFLINEKSREFLLRMCQRIAAVVAELPHCAETARAEAEITAIAKQVGCSRAAVLPAIIEFAPTADPASPGLQARPCEICGRAVNRCFEFFRHFQYDITIKPDCQQQLADRGGLCSFHTWIYEQIASPQGTCTGYAGVLDRWASRLFAVAAAQSASAARSISFPDPVICLGCNARVAAESEAVAAVAGRLRQNPQNGLGSVSDICIPHLRQLAAALGDSPIAAKLLAREAAIMQRISEDMRRYALKHDGVRRYLASDEETNAAQRALSILVGHRALNTPPPRQ